MTHGHALSLHQSALAVHESAAAVRAAAAAMQHALDFTVTAGTRASFPVIPGPSGFLGYENVTAFLQAWLPITFMGLLVIAVFTLMRVMPKTKPQEIKPEKAPTIGWNDIAGSEEAKDELREVVDYLRDRKRFK